MATILITGVAGFIGMHVCRALVSSGSHHIIGVDNLNSYYDVTLKHARLALLRDAGLICFEKLDIADRSGTEALFNRTHPDIVIHLAAQAGVRYSITNPHAYGDSNLIGFLNILEACRQSHVKTLLFASSSSVYGNSHNVPFTEGHTVDRPISLYAATKKSNELLAHAYHHLFGFSAIGLRFFTVYGPWGRPDMAYFSFTKAIYEHRPIELFNYGRQSRDFTYIDDIVDGVLRLAAATMQPDAASEYQIYNIGNNQPIELEQFVKALEQCIGIPAIVKRVAMQPGDVETTYADITAIGNRCGFRPVTPISAGLANFVDWYRHFYGERGVAK